MKRVPRGELVLRRVLKAWLEGTSYKRRNLRHRKREARRMLAVALS